MQNIWAIYGLGMFLKENQLSLDKFIQELNKLGAELAISYEGTDLSIKVYVGSKTADLFSWAQSDGCEVSKIKDIIKKLDNETARNGTLQINEILETDFALIDEYGLGNKIKGLRELLASEGRKVDLVDGTQAIRELSDKLKDYQVIAVGKGGKIVAEKAKIKYDYLPVNRNITYNTWGKEINYEIGEVKLNGKPVLLLDDVIASGDTLNKVLEKLGLTEADAASIAISGAILGDGRFPKGSTVRNFRNVYSGVRVSNDERMPKIYSVRGLIKCAEDEQFVDELLDKMKISDKKEEFIKYVNELKEVINQ